MIAVKLTALIRDANCTDKPGSRETDIQKM